jgi:hypothetical protein
VGFWNSWRYIKYFLETFVIKVLACLFANIKLAININVEAHLMGLRKM